MTNDKARELFDLITKLRECEMRIEAETKLKEDLEDKIDTVKQLISGHLPKVCVTPGGQVYIVWDDKHAGPVFSTTEIIKL